MLVGDIRRLCTAIGSSSVQTNCKTKLFIVYLFVFLESFHKFLLIIVVIRITNLILHCMGLNERFACTSILLSVHLHATMSVRIWIVCNHGINHGLSKVNGNHYVYFRLYICSSVFEKWYLFIGTNSELYQFRNWYYLFYCADAESYSEALEISSPYLELHLLSTYPSISVLLHFLEKLYVYLLSFFLPGKYIGKYSQFVLFIKNNTLKGKQRLYWEGVSNIVVNMTALLYIKSSISKVKMPYILKLVCLWKYELSCITDS